MFYNSFRTTKAALREKNKSLPGIGKQIINPRSRLVNMQKRQKLKDLLITKFMKKYGINNSEKILEKEINRFLQGEKLTDMDLQRLDKKIHALLMNKRNENNLKETLTQNLYSTKTTQNDLEENIKNLPNVQNCPKLSQNIKEDTSNLYTDANIRNSNNNAENRRLNTEGNPKRAKSLLGKLDKKYKTPLEELAALEAEEEAAKPVFERIDFASQGDEWNAIAKYNRRMYERQLEEERQKEIAQKHRMKEELDNQVKEKLKREYEDLLKEKEYNKIMLEHQKKLDDIERKKAESLKKQVLREKVDRDVQIKDEYVRRRIESLKEKKFDREIVKRNIEEIEEAKKLEIENKRKRNEALKKGLKENELNKLKKLQALRIEKENDIKINEENAKMELKEDLQRKLYFNRILARGEKFKTIQAESIIDKMKRDEKEEDEKMNFYAREINKREFEKENKRNLKIQRDKVELKHFLDMQIAEKKKDEEFEKALNNEQARIWKADVKKYQDDEKNIELKIKAMNKQNLEMLKSQMNKKKEKERNKNRMNLTEYAMNRKVLTQARDELMA